MLPAGRRELAAQHFEQAGLARTVAADEADLVTGAQPEGRIGYNDASADFYAERLGLEHSSMMAAPAAFVRE